MNKIDFVLLVSVTNANPNGDPLNGNRPRINYDGYGEISDVCIKRKIRNRLLDNGNDVFVQSADNTRDEFKCLRERAEAHIKAKGDAYAKAACEKWLDVRAFGQVFAFKGDKKDGGGVSVGVRGPVSIQSGISCSPVRCDSMQITKSVSSESGEERGSDTMGLKHRIPFGLYKINGAVNAQLAAKTGFTEADAEQIKAALLTLFENDASSARPEGSMAVCRLYWWEHNCPSGQHSSAAVHGSVKVTLKEGVKTPRSFDDYDVSLTEFDDLKPEILDGIR